MDVKKPQALDKTQIEFEEQGEFFFCHLGERGRG